MRKAVPTKPLPELETVNWQVENFCLVESKTRPQGVHYEVLQTYPKPVEHHIGSD
jgi:2'-5' RNA ligase